MFILIAFICKECLAGTPQAKELNKQISQVKGSQNGKRQ